MKKEQEMVFGTGCIQSTLDGTEHIFNIEEENRFDLPNELSWQESMPPVRNQGLSTTCVCLSLTGVLDFYHNAEVGTPGICNNYSINELYSIRADKNAPGMSFKEALHYLRHNGLNGQKINSYSKIENWNLAKYAIMMFGPIVAGFPVYSGSNPEFWKKRGFFQGGHAVTLVGYDKTGFIIRNSWGTMWGNKGHVHISYDDFQNNCFEAWTITI